MIRRIALLIIVLGLAAPVFARNIAEVTVADEVTQADGTVLHLSGAGIRSKFFFKIYIAALYLENPATDAKAVIGDSGGKRMLMHFLYDEVGKDDLVEAWNDGFSANGTEGQLKDLSAQITKFNEMFTTVKSGDEIILDFIPEQGTSVTVQGNLKGEIEGKPFNDLLLSIWLGDKPIGSDLKNQLLGL